MKVTNETIERYLRNELSPKELSDFTLQMVMNPSVRTEVEAMRTVFKTLKTTNNPVAGASGNNTILFFVIGVLLVGMLTFFYFNNGEKATPPVEEKQETVTRPIAAAFEPIEYFETFVNAQHRGETEVILTVPQNETVFNIEKNSVDLNFAGSTNSDKVLLTIWSNKLTDFENEKPVFQKEISVSPDGDFELNQTLNLSEGLYYFTLNEEAHFGKFLVKK